MPPGGLRLLLRLLCATPLPPWATDASAPRAAKLRAAALSEAAAAARALGEISERAVLRAAIYAHLDSYAAAGAPLLTKRQRTAAPAAPSSQLRRRHAERLVAGERDIWAAALAGGRQLEGREAAAAVAGALARRRRLEA